MFLTSNRATRRLSYYFFYSVLAVGCMAFSNTAGAQTDKISLWIPPIEHDSSRNLKKPSQEYHGYVVKAFLNSGKFSVVERERNKLVESERELQKSEAFIDGKFVEQGKAIGADFIVAGFLDKGGLLTLTIADVATGAQMDAQVIDLSGNVTWGDNNLATRPSWKKINKSVGEMVNRWLLKDKFTIVRILDEKGDKAKRVLIAGGSAKGVKTDNSLEVFYIETEKIDDETLERFVTIGKVKVDVVENANFSQAKVRSGETDVKKYLVEGKKLYCRFIPKD